MVRTQAVRRCFRGPLIDIEDRKRAPCSANNRAAAKPIPRGPAAPEMIAVLPLKSMASTSLRCGRKHSLKGHTCELKRELYND